MKKLELTAILCYAEEHNLMNQPVTEVLNQLNQRAPGYSALTIFDEYYVDYLDELQLRRWTMR